MSITSQQLLLLKTALETDPLVSLADDAARLDMLNAHTEVNKFRVLVADIERTLVEEGELWGIEDDITGNVEARRLTRIINARFDDISVHNPAMKDIFDGLITAGLLSTSTRNKIRSMGSENISMALGLGLPSRIRTGWLDRARAQ